MTQSTLRLLALPLLLAAVPAFAHPDHPLGSAGLLAGFAHPWLGFDHLLAMLVVGVWAAQLGGAARLWVPASFLSLMALGGSLAMRGYAPPQIEAGIAASLLVLGLLTISAWRLPLPLAMGLSGLFALFHGAAHGSELPALAQPQAYALGFLLATASLHALGLGLGHWAAQRHAVLGPASGALTLLAGLAYSCA